MSRKPAPSIDALFAGAADKVFELAEGGVQEIPLGEIRPGDNVRKTFDPETLQELAASIREHGVLQPVLVVRNPAGGYKLVAGERRWRAARMAGLETIPAIVRELTPEQTATVTLIENLQRDDLNEVERAAGLVVLKDLLGGWDAVIRKTGLSRSTVFRFAKLASLPEEAKAMVAEGKIGASTAVEIARAVNTPERTMEVLRTTVEQGLTREAARAAARGKPAPAAGGKSFTVKLSSAQHSEAETQSFTVKPPEPPGWVAADPEWRSALHVLDSPLLAAKNCRRFVDFDQRRNDFDGLMKAASLWSDGEILLILVALDLFNGRGKAAIGEIVRRLDDRNLQVVLEAIGLFRRVKG